MRYGRAVALLAAAGWLLAGCRDPLGAPLDLYHDLEGGEIAAQRPPPGAGLPYPKLGTVPAKPALPDPAYRRGLLAQLAAERDRTERVASTAPLGPLSLPPPPPILAPAPAAPSVPAGSAAPAPAAQPGPVAVPPAASGLAQAPAQIGGTASAGPAPFPSIQAAPSQSVSGQPAMAAATLDTAEAPPPKPEPAPKPQLMISVPADFGPAPGTELTIVGTPAAPSGLPDVPQQPPAPATFEGVPAEPLPTAVVMPAGSMGVPAGTPIFFSPGSAVLPAGQNQALKDFLSHRKKQSIEIIGLGEATSDSPDGQAAAVALALKRARAVADALAGMHVPQGAMRLGANAFGSGAVLNLSF